MSPVIFLQAIDTIILFPTIHLHHFLHYIYGKYIEIFKLN